MTGLDANAKAEAAEPLEVMRSSRTPDKSQQATKTPGESYGLNVPLRSRSPDTISILSANDFAELQLVRTNSNTRIRSQSHDELDVQTPRWRKVLFKAWVKNKGLILVLIAMFFGTCMNTFARLLEDEKYGAMHPFQFSIFARMSITTVLCLLYMWKNNIPDWPFGAKEVRLLLVARGTGGFFGVFGLYWSLQYLALSDATVLTFIAPFIACWACSILVKEPFTRIEKLGGLFSIIGVILIARPTAIFQSHPQEDSPPATGSSSTNSTMGHTTSNEPTSEQRLAAVGMAMVGVCGASIAYTTIRWIGKRAHSLISVTYFSTWSTLVSTVALVFVPSVPFVLPSTIAQWSLLFAAGITGFIMQYLLTAGLQYEKSSRATNMVYSQELFALLFDKIIWGSTPGVLSVIGSSLILGSAIVVAIQKDSQAQQNNKNTTSEAVQDEEMGLIPQESGVVHNSLESERLGDEEVFSDDSESGEYRRSDEQESPRRKRDVNEA